jgi:hypothetical protein
VKLFTFSGFRCNEGELLSFPSLSACNSNKVSVSFHQAAINIHVRVKVISAIDLNTKAFGLLGRIIKYSAAHSPEVDVFTCVRLVVHSAFLLTAIQCERLFTSWLSSVAHAVTLTQLSAKCSGAALTNEALAAQQANCLARLSGFRVFGSFHRKKGQQRRFL